MCTGILQKSESSDWVLARTLEFGANHLSFDLLFVPRNVDHSTNRPWKNRYAYVGFNPFNMPVVVDGINEKGLASGGFYFPGWAEFQKLDPNSPKTVVTNIEFVSWLLGNFATVQEIRDALTNTTVIGAELPAWGFVPPIHYFVADSTGDRLVIEYVKGELHTYDTPIGTITNAPTYDWHMTNVRNYIGLRALNDPSITIDGVQLSQLGQGSGAIGLPGDFTPPSRFIRASFLNQVTLSGKNALEQVERAFKILNQFDIPKGSVAAKDSTGNLEYEETLWTSASDLSGKRYYFHTAANREIMEINLGELNLDGKDRQSISLNQPEQINNLSASFTLQKK